MGPVKQNTALTTTPGHTEISSSQPYDFLVRQYVSDPLVAQTISGSGTVKGQIRVYEINALAEYCRGIIIKVVSNDGLTLRGTLLSHFPSSLESEFATSLTNRFFPNSQSLSEVVAQDGDRIVIEIGVRSFNTITSAYNAYFRFGDAAASDLPEDETSTSDYNPWVEFSQTLDFEDRLKVFQNIAQVEYDTAPKLKVSQNIVQVEYEATPPGQFVYAGDITVTVDPTAAGYDPIYAKVGDVTVTVDPTAEGYYYQPPGDFIYVGNIPVAVIPSSTTFNVRHYVGYLTVVVDPTAEGYSCPVRQYVGNIPVTVLPEAIYKVPVPGWDYVSGYGCVDFTDLGDPPPFWCIDTDGLTLAFDNTAAKFDLYAEYAMETEGGVAVEGAFEFEIVDPGIFVFTTAGGVAIGGKLDIETPEPWLIVVDVKGGVAIGGKLAITVYDPTTTLITEFTTSKGVAIGGALDFSFVEPADLITTISLSGGVVVGERRYPPIEIITPDADEVYYEFTTGGSVYVSGALEFDIPEPGAYEWTVRRGGVKVGGACTFGFWLPPITEFDIMGGVLVEGTTVEDAELYETWVLTGFSFSPSMYSGFNFNSYATRNGEVLAAKDDGIYVLEGGDDDGRPVHSGLRLGPANFGVDNLKGIRAIYPGDAGVPEAHVVAETKGREGYFKLQRDRFSVSTDLQDRLMTIEISDFERLSHFEIIPVVRVKR
jgi:hypothetical protein